MSAKLDPEEAIKQILKNDPKFTTADLSCSTLSDEQVDELAYALLHNTHVNCVRLSHTSLGDKGVKRLVKACENDSDKTDCACCHGSIGQCGFGKTDAAELPYHDDEDAKTATFLNDSLLTIRNLPSLMLRVNHLLLIEGEKHAPNLLWYHRNLHVLDLSRNSITHKGVKYLAHFIAKSDSLHTLELQHNNIGPEGAKLLCKALLCNPKNSLHALNLTECGIGADGVKHLAKVLMQPWCPIKSLKLSKNYLNCEGVKHLAKALAVNKSLTSLNLRNNGISAKGAKRLAKAIARNRTLHHLNLGANFIGAEGATAVSTALLDNTVIQSLGLKINDVGGSEGKLFANIKRLLDRNVTQFTRTCRLAFLTGFHPRLGEDSHVQMDLFDSPINDLNVTSLVFSFL